MKLVRFLQPLFLESQTVVVAGAPSLTPISYLLSPWPVKAKLLHRPARSAATRHQPPVTSYDLHLLPQNFLHHPFAGIAVFLDDFRRVEPTELGG